jgi:branched-chain amino acid transport system substrate-binding protein
MKRSIIAGVLIASAAVPAAAQAQELTVYSSLPLSGASRGQTTAVNDGARQALQEAGGMAAGRPVRLVTLNDATRRAGNWVPERVAQNARRAANDDDAIAWIGAFNSGASAIAIPILNEAAIATISPSNTAIGLTTDGPGTTRGEPEKYYPVGLQARSYFRVIPNDKVQAAALATVMRDRGCKQIVSVTDREVYGRGVGTLVRQDAARLGLQVVRTVRIGQRTRSFGRIRGADCVVYTGVTANGAVRMFRSVGGRLRSAQLFASDGVAESDFTGRLPASIARRVTVTVATLAPDAYPGGAAIIGSGDPYKIYGYEAMKLILDGLNATGATKEALLGWLRTGVQNRQSVLGTYSLDANGDTTLRTYGLYGIQRKQLVWLGAINAA